MRTISVLIATLLASTVIAQSKPSPRLGDLKAFAGTWSCKGTAFKTQWGPEHPTAATIKVWWVLGSFWLKAEYTEKKTPQNPHPAAGHVYWGYDERTKSLMGYAVDNFGGHVVIESDGWHGDTIVWNGTMSVAGMSFPTRDTFIRKSAKEVSHTTQAQMNNQWMTLNEETCRKTAP